MPDPEKKIDEEKKLADAGVRRDALGNEVVSDVPPVETKDELEPADDEKPAADEVPDLVPNPDDRPKPDDADDDETTPFDDEKTDQAIDEIVAKEGDDILAAQDAAAAKGKVEYKAKGHGLRRFFGNKWVRSILILILLGGVAALIAVPKTRYWILNTAGVRSSSSVVVVDSTTQLPLKGVEFSIGGHKTTTDSNGKAKLGGLRLGPAQLVVSQVGFEEVKRKITVGWGSNPFGTVRLQATGVRYVIEVRDYLSDKPVEGVEATDGSATAISGKDGKITLTLESPVVVKDGVSLSKAGYRLQKITLNDDPKKSTKATIVLARKAVFVSKASGKYDVYKSDIDGSNREVLLAATGNENSNISLAVSADGNRAAYVSTRDNKRDADGFLLSTLVLINVETGAKVTIAESSQIQLIDWIGTRLVYQLASLDGASSSRYTVSSYNYTDNTRLQLAAANKLGAVISAKGIVYYSVAADVSDSSVQTGLFRIGADGNGKQRVFEGELSTVLRSAYGSFSLQADDGTWYSYDLSNGSKSQVSSPANLSNRLYTDNADRTKSLWVSQGAIMSYDVASGKDTSVKTQSGLAYPVQWLSATDAIYRVSSGGETADYAVSLLGGSAHKVADVAATYGFAQAQ